MVARRTLSIIAALWVGLTVPAALSRADLLAEGANERLWMAQVVVNADKNLPGRRTIIRVRTAGESERWRQVAEIAAPAQALAHRGEELIVLLENGDWRLVGESGVRSGDPLPGHQPILALAGDGETLWSIGMAVADSAPATRAASRPTTGRGGAGATVPLERSASTTATTTPASGPRQRMLYRLERGAWRPVKPLPDRLIASDAPLTMMVLDRRPLIASATAEGVLQTIQLDAAGAWEDRGTVRPLFELRELDLLDYRGRARLWAAPQAGAGVVYELHEGAWGEPIELQTHAPLEPGTDRALAAAFGRLRLLYAGGDQQLNEQSFAADGAADGPPTRAAVEAPPPDPRATQLVQLVVMVLLMFVMLSTLRRRGSIQEAMRKADRLPLAPLLPRFLAGAVDALPLIAVPVVLLVTSPSVEAASARMNEPIVQAWYGGAVLLYLVYTAAAEMLFGRTLGKWILGLRVASLDGTRLSGRAALIRNAMRIIDLTLVLFPLIMVVLSPLRQRIGDVAAGTLVIRDSVVIPPQGENPTGEEE